MESNNQGTLASLMVSMSPLLPTNTTAWFALLERQFEAARITDKRISPQAYDKNERKCKVKYQFSTKS